MLEWWQALLLGALQGVSELFPVSSLAHTILVPKLLNWSVASSKASLEASSFLSFVVALHLATAIALLVFFWREWRTVIKAYIGSIQRRRFVYDRNSKFAWLLIAGTVVVGVIGLIFEKQLRQFFEDPKYVWLVALFLVINGAVMLFGEFLRRRDNAAKSNRKSVEDLTFVEGGAVGAAQTLALLPGISRSGATMVSGLLAGLSHEEAARFSFMLATPVIGLAALLKLPDLFKPEARDILAMTVPAAILAGITAYLSVRFLMRYFETKRLSPFGYYCIVFGIAALVIIQIRG